MVRIKKQVLDYFFISEDLIYDCVVHWLMKREGDAVLGIPLRKPHSQSASFLHVQSILMLP